MKTSFSALNTFQSCPLKYKFQVTDKISTPKSPEAVFGTLIHSTLQFIHSGGFLPPTEQEALQFFATKWNPDVFEQELQERTAFAQGVRIIQQYFHKNDPAKIQIVDLESRFSIELDDKEREEKHFVSGFIDRIDKTEDGYEIIDYKTSKKLPPQELVDNNLQLSIYLLAFLKRYPNFTEIEKVKLSLFFVHHGEKLTTTKTKKDLETVKEELVEVIHQVEESDFPAIVSPLCAWCGYQKVCPMWKHKFKKVVATTDEEKNETIKEYILAQENAKNERKRAAELQEKILEIMEAEKAERLFSEGKIVSKTCRQTFGYDEKRLQEILERERLWNEVVKLNQTQLKKVVASLPSSTKKEIEKIRELKKESFGLSIKKGEE